MGRPRKHNYAAIVRFYNKVKSKRATAIKFDLDRSHLYRILKKEGVK